MGFWFLVAFVDPVFRELQRTWGQAEALSRPTPPFPPNPPHVPTYRYKHDTDIHTDTLRCFPCFSLLSKRQKTVVPCRAPARFCVGSRERLMKQQLAVENLRDI